MHSKAQSKVLIKKVSIDEEQCLRMEKSIYILKNLKNLIIRKLGHRPMTPLQSLKEKKSKQRIDIDYMENN